MRPPRFRVRTLMVAVAVAALVLGGLELRGRKARFRAQAAYHSRRWSGLSLVKPTPPARTRSRERHAVYHDEMRRKYDWAARSPWLPVAPDPPGPE
jgi:hypothetical protein